MWKKEFLTFITGHQSFWLLNISVFISASAFFIFSKKSKLLNPNIYALISFFLWTEHVLPGGVAGAEGVSVAGEHVWTAFIPQPTQLLKKKRAVEFWSSWNNLTGTDLGQFF